MLSRTLATFLSRRALSCAENTVLLSTGRTAKSTLKHSSFYVVRGRPCKRLLSTPAPHITYSDLSIDRYNALSDATMVTLFERLEDVLDEIGNDAFEVDYHSGVLTLNLASNGTYVINKQPPNKQIWLSSPVSGPKRYDYVPSTDDWRYSRDGEGMGTLLEQELSHALGGEVKLGLEHVSQTKV